ncbi:hypothetical protein [Roseicitreum antarcticum]|uniref:Uncharacterized protein n=1 Tax=Roseicitreum antarcticum TaxID=564137 RepID=A0A1H3E5N5_9RHOB|nr:hypothetical protein [Roseicitreum antarcticum]SDX73568.1 hypothetical protein SAMN04488238_1185 [Roseicitreum antarcticum]
MTLTRPRKARILEAAGLRYVAGWLPHEKAKQVLQEIEEAESLVNAALPKVSK